MGVKELKDAVCREKTLAKYGSWVTILSVQFGAGAMRSGLGLGSLGGEAEEGARER